MTHKTITYNRSIEGWITPSFANKKQSCLLQTRWTSTRCSIATSGTTYLHLNSMLTLPDFDMEAFCMPVRVTSSYIVRSREQEHEGKAAQIIVFYKLHFLDIVLECSRSSWLLPQRTDAFLLSVHPPCRPCECLYICVWIQLILPHLVICGQMVKYPLLTQVSKLWTIKWRPSQYTQEVPLLQVFLLNQYFSGCSWWSNEISIRKKVSHTFCVVGRKWQADLRHQPGRTSPLEKEPTINKMKKQAWRIWIHVKGIYHHNEWCFPDDTWKYKPLNTKDCHRETHVKLFRHLLLAYRRSINDIKAVKTIPPERIRA